MGKVLFELEKVYVYKQVYQNRKQLVLRTM